MTAMKQVSDSALLDRLEDMLRAGERIELDHGKGDGFLAGSYVGPSLRDALLDLIEGWLSPRARVAHTQ